ncbi:MAG TPA: hypothetical protein VGU20_04245, partial [Stellaceae bacterium]|nr:hypothetical protein [Stellaceae bacterium]
MTTNANNAPPSNAPGADTVASFQATAQRFGLSADAVNKTLAAHSVQPQQQPGQQQPVGGAGGQAFTDDPRFTGERPVVDTLDEHKLPSLSDAQKLQAANTLSKYWTGNQQVLEDALKAAGIERVPDEDLGPHKRSQAEKDFDNAFGGVAADTYDLQGAYLGARIEAAELPNVDRNFRSMLEAISMP